MAPDEGSRPFLSYNTDPNPSLDPLIGLYELDPKNIILDTGQRYLRLRGPAISNLIRSLDGDTPMSTLARRFGANDVEHVMDVLERRNLLVRGEEPAPPHQLASTPEELQDCVLATSSPARAFISGFASIAGLRRAGTRVLVVDSYLRTEIALASAEEDSWLLVKLGSESVSVSPVFARGGAPCWNCVLTRILARDDVLAKLLHGGYRPLSFARKRSSQAPSYELAVAAQIERQLIRQTRSSATTYLVSVARAGRVSEHPLVSLTSCATCGRAGIARAGTAVAGRGQSSESGLWHSVRARLDPLLDPVTGVVDDRYVCPVTPESPVVVAVATYASPSPLAALPRIASTPDLLWQDGVSDRVAFGGGASAEDARARAVLEAVERYSTTEQGDEWDCSASLAELGDAALHPNALMCFDESQLRHEPETAGAARELRTPRLYTQDIRLRWCIARTLTGVERWLPVAYCYRVRDEDPDAAYCVYDSNGSAAAFSIDHAIVSGFLEVVERDSVAIWWYNRIPRPLVDVDSFDDSFCSEMLARQRAAGCQLRVFDVTGELDIPTFVAMSVRRPGDIPRFGFGAHFDARSALRASLLELGQAICFHAQESRKWAGFEWSGQPHLTPVERAPRRAQEYRQAAEVPTVGECAAAAATVGAEILVRDCSRADIGLPCVKVVVPGMRGIRPRFGPGRLFEAPHRLGWLSRPRSLGELNPEYLRS